MLQWFDTNLIYFFLYHCTDESLGVAGMNEYACYGQILDIQCKGNKVIVFDRARYGRNDTQIATACDTHYKVTCWYSTAIKIQRLWVIAKEICIVTSGR